MFYLFTVYVFIDTQLNTIYCGISKEKTLYPALSRVGRETLVLIHCVLSVGTQRRLASSPECKMKILYILFSTVGIDNIPKCCIKEANIIRKWHWYARMRPKLYATLCYYFLDIFYFIFHFCFDFE